MANFEALLQNGVAECVASEVNDFTCLECLEDIVEDKKSRRQSIISIPLRFKTLSRPPHQWESSNIVVFVGGTVTELYILVFICISFNYLLIKEKLVR